MNVTSLPATGWPDGAVGTWAPTPPAPTLVPGATLMPARVRTPAPRATARPISATAAPGAGLVAVDPTVEPQDPVDPLPGAGMQHTMSYISGTAGVATAVSTGGALGAAMRLALVAEACYPEKWGLQGGEKYSLMMSPLQLVVDDSKAFGTVVGNTVIMVGAIIACALGWLLVTAVARCTHIPYLMSTGDKKGLASFPSWSLFVLLAIYQGITLGSVDLLLHPTSIVSLGIAVTGAISSIAAPAILTTAIVRGAPSEAIFQKDLRSQRLGKVVIWMIGDSCWISRRREHHWVGRLYSAVNGYAPGGHWYWYIEYTASFTLSALHATRPETLVACGHIKSASALIFVFLAYLEWFHARRRLPRHRQLMTALATVKAGAMLAMAIGHYSGRSSHVGKTAADVLLMIAVAVLAMQSGLDVLTAVYDFASGRLGRLQHAQWGLAPRNSPTAWKGKQVCPNDSQVGWTAPETTLSPGTHGVGTRIELGPNTSVSFADLSMSWGAFTSSVSGSPNKGTAGSDNDIDTSSDNALIADAAEELRKPKRSVMKARSSSTTPRPKSTSIARRPSETVFSAGEFTCVLDGKAVMPLAEMRSLSKQSLDGRVERLRSMGPLGPAVRRGRGMVTSLSDTLRDNNEGIDMLPVRAQRAMSIANSSPEHMPTGVTGRRRRRQTLMVTESGFGSPDLSPDEQMRRASVISPPQRLPGTRRRGSLSSVASPDVPPVRRSSLTPSPLPLSTRRRGSLPALQEV